MTLLGESTHSFCTHLSVFDEKKLWGQVPFLVSSLGWTFSSLYLELVSNLAPENVFASSDDLASRIYALVFTHTSVFDEKKCGVWHPCFPTGVDLHSVAPRAGE